MLRSSSYTLFRTIGGTNNGIRRGFIGNGTRTKHRQLRAKSISGDAGGGSKGGATNPKQTTTAAANENGKNGSTKAAAPSVVNKILDPSNPVMTKPIFQAGTESSAAATSTPSLSNTSNMSAAVLAGHSAFFLTGLAYATKDVMHLRLLAMGGISLSMIFQYYRPQPLSIPLRWNALFLAVNAAMVAALYKERREAENMGPEFEALFSDGDFQKRGFGRVEFYRLFQLAKREELKAGYYLKRAGEEMKNLYIITKGSATIERNGVKLQSISQYDTCGELEFIAYIDDDKETDSVATASVYIDGIYADDKKGGDSNNGSVDGAIVYVWDIKELASFLSNQPRVSNALLAYISHELSEKLTDSWELKSPVRKKEESNKEKEELAKHFLHLMEDVSGGKNEAIEE